MRCAVLALCLVFAGACVQDSPPEDASVPQPGGSPEAASPRRGLWVLAEGSHRTLEDPARVDRLVLEAEKLGVTDLFVQVYRAGKSWFPSSVADAAPYEKTRNGYGAMARPDGLHRLLDAAHAKQIRVHAWVNALSLHRNRDAPLLRSVGREAVLVDRQGRSLLDYPGFDVPPPDRDHTRLGTPGLFLDPATPGVIEALEKVVDELVAAAPELDGLHLDFIRHPLALPIVPGSRFDGLDFGYGAPSVERFELESKRPFKRGDAWDEFRRERVHDVVRRLNARLPEGWEHSAAVLPWADRAYLSSMQDWRRWLEEDSLDFAVAMLYTRDDRLLRYTARSLVGGVAGDRVWIGLGTWLFVSDAPRARTQLSLAESVHPPGVALFSYDALAERPETLDALARPSSVPEP